MNEITVCEGKYTFRLPEKAGDPIQMLRYGQPWMELTVTTPGYRAFDALLSEVIEDHKKKREAA